MNDYNEGFYNASGSEEYLIQQVMKKYGMTREQAIFEIQKRKSTEGSETGKKNWFSEVLGTASNIFGKQPTDGTYVPAPNMPSEKEGFKIAGMNGYLVIGGAAVVVVGLIFAATKLGGQKA